MNELPSAPVPEPEPAAPHESFWQTWQKALTQPNELTYAQIASSPYAKATTAYLWVFVAGLIQFFLSALVQGQMIRNLSQYGFDFGNVAPRSGAGLLVSLLCLAPITAALGTLVFAVWVAVVQWLARMFGGTGTYDRLAYALAAIAAPYSILAGIMALLSAIPYVGLCFSGLLFLAGLYVLVLQVMAIKGVNSISWGAAIGSFLIPGVALALICACIFGVSFAALIPIIRQTYPNFRP